MGALCWPKAAQLVGYGGNVETYLSCAALGTRGSEMKRDSVGMYVCMSSFSSREPSLCLVLFFSSSLLCIT